MTVYDFGLRLKELRQKKKLSQGDVANKLGVSKNTIYCYESNLKMPSVARLVDIAVLYNTSLDYIMGLDHMPVIRLHKLTDEQQQVIFDFIKNFT